MRILSGVLIISCLLLAGCPSARRDLTGAAAGFKPITLQLQNQDDSLQGQKFRTLLDFERESDLVFVKSEGQRLIDPIAHTGGAAMKLSGASATMRIASVLFSTRLPGDWTLLGCYVRPEVDTPVVTTLLDGATELAQTRRVAPAGQWTFVSIDLTDPKVAEALPGAGALALRLDLPALGALATINIDDVLLVDNARTLLDTLADGAGGWKISRRGYTTTIDAPGRFKIDLTAAAASESGWVLAEYGPTRAIFKSAGPVKQWTLYNDGRWIQDGRMSVKGADGAAAMASHRSPARIDVDEATGKLDIHTEGDADNDGYNEARGVYQIVARAPRVQIKVTPVEVPASAPTLEIDGLPPGRVTAMVEGRLIDKSVRLPDGRALLILPLRIERPTSVTLRALSDNAP